MFAECCRQAENFVFERGDIIRPTAIKDFCVIEPRRHQVVDPKPVAPFGIRVAGNPAAGSNIERSLAVRTLNSDVAKTALVKDYRSIALRTVKSPFVGRRFSVGDIELILKELRGSS